MNFGSKSLLATFTSILIRSSSSSDFILSGRFSITSNLISFGRINAIFKLSNSALSRVLVYNNNTKDENHKAELCKVKQLHKKRVRKHFLTRLIVYLSIRYYLPIIHLNPAVKTTPFLPPPLSIDWK